MYVCSDCGFSLPTAGFCPHHGSPLESKVDPMLGRTIGKFRLARRLGSGAMANVYLGVHSQIGSQVAIKILTQKVAAEPHYVDRFFLEARATNRIQHDGIVNVMDLDTLPSGEPYIIMEYLEGDVLSAHLNRDPPLSLENLVSVIEETLDALDAAHAAGIVHRDLKPSNIFLTHAGRAKIIDFGVAKLRQGAALTAKGALVGTPHYMAPEQIQGGALDGRTDLYAVGVILYRGATGRYPFNGESLFEIIRAHLEEPIPLARSHRLDLPLALQAVINKALQKDPASRFASASEMKRALAEAVTDRVGVETGGRFPDDHLDSPTEVVVPESSSDTTPAPQKSKIMLTKAAGPLRRIVL